MLHPLFSIKLCCVKHGYTAYLVFQYFYEVNCYIVFSKISLAQNMIMLPVSRISDTLFSKFSRNRARNNK